MRKEPVDLMKALKASLDVADAASQLKPCPRCGQAGGLIYCNSCHGPKRQVPGYHLGTPRNNAD